MSSKKYTDSKIINSPLGLRIAETRLKMGLNQTDFAKILDLKTPGAVSHWEKGVRKPDIDMIKKIADLSGEDFYWLLTGEQFNDPQRDGNKIIKEGLKMAETRRIKKSLSIYGLQTFRIISDLSAGEPKLFFDDNQLGDDQDIVLPYPHKNCVVLRVQGDSMTDKIQSGDLVLVDLFATPKNGDIVAVILANGEQMIKRYKEIDGLNIFYSENEEYEPIIKTKKEVTKVKKVVRIIKDVS
jgi:phage repressor protein C with HTH and peptisase S24 domain